MVPVLLGGALVSSLRAGVAAPSPGRVAEIALGPSALGLLGHGFFRREDALAHPDDAAAVPQRHDVSKPKQRDADDGGMQKQRRDHTTIARPPRGGGREASSRRV